jgi:hypothetical protein
MDGPARLAKRLLILASLHGRAAHVGRLELRISRRPSSHASSASRAGRQSAPRRLAETRLDRARRTQIVIRNAEALRAMIAGGARL